MSETREWKIKGGWFDVCRCDVPCPCSWAQPPDDGFCEGILLWHIDEGNYGSVRLDGLNVAMIVRFRGNVWEKATSMAQAFFMDERADEAPPPHARGTPAQPWRPSAMRFVHGL